MLRTTHRLTAHVARGAHPSLGRPTPGRHAVSALATPLRAALAPPPAPRPGLVGAVPSSRGLRASSATARGLKTGIVGLPNVGKVGCENKGGKGALPGVAQGGLLLSKLLQTRMRVVAGKKE